MSCHHEWGYTVGIAAQDGPPLPQNRILNHGQIADNCLKMP